jgi:membrane fusion protein (multidrug efflux system)
MKKAITWTVAGVLLVGGALGGYHYWSESRRAVSTDDAYVEADVTAIASEVPGRITAVHVKDNQAVKKGELLVSVEPDDYRSRLDQAQRALRAAEQKALAARADYELIRVQAESAVSEEHSGVQVSQAAVETARSNVEQERQRHLQAQAVKRTNLAGLRRLHSEVEVAEAERGRLENDARRYRALYAKDEVSRQQLEQVETSLRQAQARVQSAQRQVQAGFGEVAQAQASIGQAAEAVRTRQAQVLEAESKVDQARSKLASAQSAPQKVAAALAQVKVAQAEVERAQVEVTVARREVERAQIRAPRDGVVSKRSAQIGAYVQKGSPLLSLVAHQEVWVQANYKETQMERFRPGLKAELVVDTYPGKVFHGHLESMQAGTGSRFSMLPAENASGSFVKVVQRIPVKIVLDDQPSRETPLVPGMSVVSRVLLVQ